MGKRRRGRRGADEVATLRWSGDGDPSQDPSSGDTDPPDASSAILFQGVTQQRLLPEDEWFVERWTEVSAPDPCGDHLDARRMVGCFQGKDATLEAAKRHATPRLESVYVLTSHRRFLGRGHRLDTTYLRAEDVIAAERGNVLVASARAKLTDAEWEAVLQEALRRSR